MEKQANPNRVASAGQILELTGFSSSISWYNFLVKKGSLSRLDFKIPAFLLIKGSKINKKATKDKRISILELSRYCVKLRPKVEDLVNKAGFELYEMMFTTEDKTNYLRVTIKKENTPISLDDCEMVSRGIDKELDDSDSIPFSYVLEVQSSGIEVSSFGKDKQDLVLDS